MAGHQLTGHPSLDGYLAELRRRLPAGAVHELADGLAETWHHHLAAGRAGEDAARAAIAEFGTTDQVTSAFVSSAPGRRTARILLATGPLAGLCWGASLTTAQVWTWPVPTAAMLLPPALLAVVAALVVAATTRGSYRYTRLGGLGGIGLAVLDAVLVTGVLLLAPALVWPMAIAIPASLARIGWTLRRVPAALS